VLRSVLVRPSEAARDGSRPPRLYPHAPRATIRIFGIEPHHGNEERALLEEMILRWRMVPHEMRPPAMKVDTRSIFHVRAEHMVGRRDLPRILILILLHHFYDGGGRRGTLRVRSRGEVHRGSKVVRCRKEDNGEPEAHSSESGPGLVPRTDRGDSHSSRCTFSRVYRTPASAMNDPISMIVGCPVSW
jgi:hypothetical protein